MRRFLHGLLVGVLTLWIPLDSAVAGWWHHHHRHASPVVWGPAFPPPCGIGAPFPGWAGAIVIDDRPLGAPSPFAVQIAVPTEVVVGEWVTTGPVEGSIVDECVIEGSASDCVCDPCQDGGVVGSDVVVEEGVTGTQAPIIVEGESYGTVIERDPDSDTPTPAEPPLTGNGGPISTGRPVASTPRTEPTPEAESPTPLELPNHAATTTSGDAATAAQPSTADAPASSVLEPWEPKTVQGDPTADDMPADEPVAITDDSDEGSTEAFERPDEPMGDEDSIEEPMADDSDAAPPVQPKPRNLFDEVPADEQDAFEAPPASGDDDLPPGDAFDAPDDGFEASEEAMEEPGSDDDFGIPEEPPMDDAPADEMEGDSFEQASDEPMDETPADEPAGDEGAADAEPGADAEPEADEAPVEKDPFDANVLHTPGQPSRSWRDDTGRHGTEGRLVEVRADRVRILKATGRYTTVPMSRLSAADRDHVAGVALALGRPAAPAADTAGL